MAEHPKPKLKPVSATSRQPAEQVVYGVRGRYDFCHTDRIADLVAVRDAFRSRWASGNVARAGTSTLALACLGWALAQGQTS